MDALFGLLKVFRFGFAALARPTSPFDRARLVAFREPAAFAFRRFVRFAIVAHPSEAAQRIKDGVESISRFATAGRGSGVCPGATPEKLARSGSGARREVAGDAARKPADGF